MKFHKIFVLLFLILISNTMHAGEKEEAWRALSAHSQNLHRLLLLMGPDTGADPSNHEEALKGIEASLDSLVRLGELESKKIRLKSPEKIGDKVTQKVLESIDPLSKIYGVFVASEMCDLGARLYFLTLKKDEEVELHLRLPKKAMKEFETALANLDVLTKSVGTRRGAEQPDASE